MMIIDRRWTILGSFNMDIRSFRLNFELNLLIYGKSFANEAIATFQEDLRNSKQVELETFQKRLFISRMIENAARILSPIL